VTLVTVVTVSEGVLHKCHKCHNRHTNSIDGKDGENMELTYTEIGDCFYPNLTLPETNDDRLLGKYGML